MNKRRIGILTSGGDCPGLNAVIRGVVRAADNLNWEVIGFIDGFEGLLQPGDYRILDRHTTATIMSQGGTILGTTNKGHFISKVGAGNKLMVAPEIVENAREILHKLRIDGLILIGGDGSLTTGLQLYEAGFPIIGVPKTIDNDLEATAMTFGFDSAVACVADALDRLQTTGVSHKRVMILEVMGRHAGWIALYGGLAGGANAILIPEIPFSYEKLANYIKQRDRDNYFSSLVVVAEGAKPIGGEEQVRASGSGGEYKLGGIGEDGDARDCRAHGQGNAQLRPGPSPARRHADDAGPHPGHPFRGQGRGADRREEVRHDGFLPELPGARRADRRCGPQAASGHPEPSDGPNVPRRGRVFRRLARRR